MVIGGRLMVWHPGEQAGAAGAPHPGAHAGAAGGGGGGGGGGAAQQEGLHVGAQLDAHVPPHI
jgi:hypothetical protein